MSVFENVDFNTVQMSIENRINAAAEKFASKQLETSTRLDVTSSFAVPDVLRLLVNKNGKLFANITTKAGKSVPFNVSAAMQNKIFSESQFAKYEKTIVKSASGEDRIVLVRKEGEKVISPSIKMNNKKLSMWTSVDGDDVFSIDYSGTTDSYESNA